MAGRAKRDGFVNLTPGIGMTQLNPAPARGDTGGFVRRTLIPFLVALAYASFLTSLPIDAFKDRAYYFIYTTTSDIIFYRYLAYDIKTIFANEPLWLYINFSLINILTPDQIIRSIIFFSAFVSSFILMRNENKNLFWIMVFLLMPAIIKNYIIHLRQGLAITIFIAGYYSQSRTMKPLLLAMTPFIHSSFFFILMMAGINYATGVMKFPLWMRVTFITVCYIATAAMLDVVASGVGARQIREYADAAIDVSGVGFAFWTCVFLLFLSSGVAFLRSHTLPTSLLAFYLGTYFIVPFAARILESGLFLVLVCGLAMQGWRKAVFLAMLILFILLTYYTQINEPWFGWAA
jgi:hypothetical protein